MWPHQYNNSKMPWNQPKETWILHLSSDLQLSCHKFQLEYAIEQYLECQLKTWRWIRNHSQSDHQTQDQRVRTFWSLPVQGMEFAPVQGMAGNFQYNLHSRIVLRLYDCKWKILCKVDCCQNIHYQAFWKCHVITKSCCRAAGWQTWGAEWSSLY